MRIEASKTPVNLHQQRAAPPIDVSSSERTSGVLTLDPVDHQQAGGLAALSPSQTDGETDERGLRWHLGTDSDSLSPIPAGNAEPIAIAVPSPISNPISVDSLEPVWVHGVAPYLTRSDIGKVAAASKHFYAMSKKEPQVKLRQAVQPLFARFEKTEGARRRYTACKEVLLGNLELIKTAPAGGPTGWLVFPFLLIALPFTLMATAVTGAALALARRPYARHPDFDKDIESFEKLVKATRSKHLFALIAVDDLSVKVEQMRGQDAGDVADDYCRSKFGPISSDEFRTVKKVVEELMRGGQSKRGRVALRRRLVEKAISDFKAEMPNIAAPDLSGKGRMDEYAAILRIWHAPPTTSMWTKELGAVDAGGGYKRWIESRSDRSCSNEVYLRIISLAMKSLPQSDFISDRKAAEMTIQESGSGLALRLSLVDHWLEQVNHGEQLELGPEFHWLLDSVHGAEYENRGFDSQGVFQAQALVREMGSLNGRDWWVGGAINGQMAKLNALREGLIDEGRFQLARQVDMDAPD